MAFSILNSPVDYYSGENFNLWSFSTGWVAGNSPAQQQHIYTLNTTGVGSLILVPDVGVSPNSYGSGVNGVETWLTYRPSGSISGPTISVYMAMGSFAYSYDLGYASEQLVADLNTLQSQGVNVSSVFDNWSTEINYLLKPGVAQAGAVESYFDGEVQSMSAQGFATLAQDARTLAAIANEWTTPVTYINLNQGAGWQQVSESAIDFGIDVSTVNGATSTWSVNGASGSVTVSGFTVVGYWNGDPDYGGNGYYDFEPGQTNGWLDVASYAPAHNQTISVSQLISQSVQSNGQTIANYILWETGSGGAQLLLNGAAQSLQQNVVVSPSQLSQAQYKTGSGSDTFWVQVVYLDGSKSDWVNIGIASPVDTGPTVSVTSISASHGAVFNASSLFTGYSDPFAMPRVSYDFWNSGTGGGYFQPGTVLPPFAPNQDVIVPASGLAGLQYHTGSGTDTLWVRAFDGTVWVHGRRPFRSARRSIPAQPKP